MPPSYASKARTCISLPLRLHTINLSTDTQIALLCVIVPLLSISMLSPNLATQRTLIFQTGTSIKHNWEKLPLLLPILVTQNDAVFCYVALLADVLCHEFSLAK